MNAERIAKNVLLIALGGSGKKTAVLLREKISFASQENGGGNQVNLKIVSIDFPVAQYDGYFVKPDEYFPILRYGINITQCWQALNEELKSMPKEDQEQWMSVGPISEIELWLARDAQQSGIRRVDYFLLVHQERVRIQEKIREALSAFRQERNSNSEISIIIVGSLVGRTGSISYIPVLRILESLSTEYKFASSFSFLYTPKAFEMPVHIENEMNFFRSLSRIRRHFGKESAKSLSLTQILVDERNPVLTSHRDAERPLPYSQIIESIGRLIDLAETEFSPNGLYEEWFHSIKLIEITEIDEMAERYKQVNKHHANGPFAIPQNWNTDLLEQVFANLEKKI